MGFGNERRNEVSENTKIWDALAKTDPKHTKPFQRAGGFKGTAVKPIYLSLKMTEHFGACGEGWGMAEPKFQVVQAGEKTAVYCTVGLWYSVRDNIVYGVGGDIVAGSNKNGPFIDDEAFKKSYTDALGNAMKQIGMSADVHMGQHDDDKYVRELREEFSGVKPDVKSKPTTAKTPFDKPDPKQLAETIKAAIDATTTLDALNLVMVDAVDDLQVVKTNKAEAHKFLVDRAEKRRRWFADQP